MTDQDPDVERSRLRQKLSAAVMRGDMAGVAEGIKDNAPLDKGPHGHSPLDFARDMGNERQVLKILHKPQDELDRLLYVAAMLGNAKNAKSALMEGANPDVSNVNGDSALHQAVNQGGLETVKLLLAFGASLKATNKSGNMAHEAAAIDGEIPTVTYMKRILARTEPLPTLESLGINRALVKSPNFASRAIRDEEIYPQAGDRASWHSR